MWWSTEHPHFAHRGELTLDVEPEFPESPARGADTHLTITAGVRRDDGFRCTIRVDCCDVRDILGGLPRLARESETQFRLGLDTPSLDLYAKFDPLYGVMVTFDEVSLTLGALDNRRLRAEGSAPFLLSLLPHIEPESNAGESLSASDIKKYSNAIQFSDLAGEPDSQLHISAVWSGFGFWDSRERFIRTMETFLRKCVEIMGDPVIEDQSLSAHSRAVISSLEGHLGPHDP